MYSQVFPHPSLGGEDVDGILYLRVGYHEVGVHMYRASGSSFTMTALGILDLLLEGGAGLTSMDVKLHGSGLILIGLGPGDLGLMTKNAIDTARDADFRFLEGYTATLPSDQEGLLTEFLGEWTMIMRPDVENPTKLLDLAERSTVALLVVGDPMHATTHIDLLLRAKDSGIPTLVIPGISATSLAVTRSGLQSYRFGRQITLPYSYGDYLPTSPLELLFNNLSNNLHTLVLLDLDPTGMGVKKPVPMSPGQAGEILVKMHEKMDGTDTPIPPFDTSFLERECILLSDLGTPDQSLCSGSLDDIAGIQSGRIHCMIVPAEMDDIERAAFEGIRI